MRLFEIFVVGLLLPSILYSFLPRSRPTWLITLSLLGTIFIGVHLFVEGYRWQMVPAYGLTAVYLLINLRWGLNSIPPTQTARLAGIVGLFIWLIATTLPIVMPVPRLPAATGPYPVGTFTTYLVDNARLETYTDAPDDNRELMAQVWYPAANREGEAAKYMEALSVAGPVIAEQFDLPAFLLNHINLTELNIWLDVPSADEGSPFPVIVFSHGLTGIRMQNTVMMRELASHGYVVAAVDHTYGNAISVFPDGRVFVYDPQRIFPSGESNPVEANPLVQVWSEDIAFLLDEMTRWHEEAGHLLNGRLDLTHVGVFGHSTGGAATMEFCLKDERCQAGVGLDSWVLPLANELREQVPDQPFMFISSDSWLGPENQQLGENSFAALNNDGYNLTMVNTRHYDFTDIPLLTPLTPQLGLSGSINSEYSLSIQNEYLLAFFNQYLKGMPSTLLTEAASPYPELTIERNLRP